jgi:hypothetical protein
MIQINNFKAYSQLKVILNRSKLRIPEFQKKIILIIAI